MELSCDIVVGEGLGNVLSILQEVLLRYAKWNPGSDE